VPRVVTTVHDPAALAVTCRRLGLAPPGEGTVRLGAEAVFGWVVRLPGLCHPVVCDTLTGLVAYHPADNAHDRYAHLIRFLFSCYDVRAELRRGGTAGAAAPPRRQRAAGGRAARAATRPDDAGPAERRRAGPAVTRAAGQRNPVQEGSP
jgi:hypothetical protein